MIRAEQLTKHYEEVEAVRSISFSIGEGEVVGLLGPNGAGKSTTMRMLTTFIAPTEGTATIAGFDVCSESDAVRKNIGYLPEVPPVYPELRVLEYLKFVTKIKGIPRAERKEAIEKILVRCGLTEVATRVCGKLSKGFRQRVGIAQALVHNPKVIILDEPTSGLDPEQIIEIRNLIAELKGDHTVIVSTHLLAEVAQTCSRVIIIANGEIVTDGSIEELTHEKSLEERYLEVVAPGYF